MRFRPSVTTYNCIKSPERLDIVAHIMANGSLVPLSFSKEAVVVQSLDLMLHCWAKAQIVKEQI